MTSIVKTGQFFIDSYGFESTYGTPATIDEPTGIHQNTTLTVKNNFIRYYGGAGTRDPSNLIAGKKEVRGSTSTIVQNGKIFQAFWGAADTTGSGPYTHVLDAYDGSGDEKDLLSLTFELSSIARGSGSNEVYTTPGVYINDFTLTFAEEIETILDFNWIAQDLTSGSSITSVSQDTDEPFMFYHGVITVDGVEIATIERGTFVGRNNLEPYYPVTTTDPRLTAEPILNQREYELSLTFKMTDSVQMDKILTASNTGVTVTLAFTRGANDSMTVTASNAVFEQDDVTFNVSEKTVEALTLYPKTALITFVDSVASYA